MPTSDEELRKQQQTVEQLRQQVAAAEEARLTRQVEVANDVTMTELQAEEARLRARLAEVKDAGKVGAVKQGMDAPLSAAKEALVAGVARQKAAEKSTEEKGLVPTSEQPEVEPVTVPDGGER